MRQTAWFSKVMLLVARQCEFVRAPGSMNVVASCCGFMAEVAVSNCSAACKTDACFKYAFRETARRALGTSSMRKLRVLVTFCVSQQFFVQVDYVLTADVQEEVTICRVCGRSSTGRHVESARCCNRSSMKHAKVCHATAMASEKYAINGHWLHSMAIHGLRMNSNSMAWAAHYVKCGQSSLTGSRAVCCSKREVVERQKLYHQHSGVRSIVCMCVMRKSERSIVCLHTRNIKV